MINLLIPRFRLLTSPFQRGNFHLILQPREQKQRHWCRHFALPPAATIIQHHRAIAPSIYICPSSSQSRHCISFHLFTCAATFFIVELTIHDLFLLPPFRPTSCCHHQPAAVHHPTIIHNPVSSPALTIVSASTYLLVHR
jgi:hypothetical protein